MSAVASTLFRPELRPVIARNSSGAKGLSIHARHISPMMHGNEKKGNSARAEKLSTNGPLNSMANNRAIAYRSEEQTSELQSLMRSSYAVFCLTKKKTNSS